MKRFLSIFLVILMILSFTACGEIKPAKPKVDLTTTEGYIQGEVEGGDYSDDLVEPYYDENGKYNPTVMGVFYRNAIGADITADDEVSKEINGKADDMLKKIVYYPDSIKAAEGKKTYYISNDGDDKNDGLTPQTPRKTYEAVGIFLQDGDAVLFRRGDIFRGKMKLVSGVSYGAYGSGIKPRIYGSADGKDGEWVESEEYPGVYTFSKYILCCNIIFDNGKEISRPVYSMEQLVEKPYNVYLNSKGISVYSPDGNPADLFDNIEIAEDYYLFTCDSGTKNVKMQNIAFMYTGQATRGAAENFEVEGCIFGYSGGTKLYLYNNAISIGNGIDFWAVTKNVKIHDCYIFQAFDAGITHQGPVSAKSFPNGVDYSNIYYQDNLIEYCTYGIEVFSMRSVKEKVGYEDANWDYGLTTISGNIIRYSGYGWGSMDRPDKGVYADFKYDAQGENDTTIHKEPLIIENNILYGTRKTVFSIQSPESNKANMIMKNNLIVTNKNAVIYKGLKATEDFESKIKQFYTYESNTFKIIN